MVLISIHPFALRKLCLIIVAFLGFSALCFADPVLMVRRYSARPDSPKIPTQEAGQFLDAGENSAPGTAVRPIEAESPESAATLSAGVRNPVCVFRAPASAERPLEAPVVELRKI
jgi:hypothetical protein